MIRHIVRILDQYTNAIGLPEYHPGNINDRMDEIRQRHLFYADRWLPDGPGLWRAGGYILRPGWRIYRPTKRRTPA